MSILIYLIEIAFNIAYFVIIAQVAIHWLAIFGVVNTENPKAQQVIEGLQKLTAPVYDKISQFVPPIGGIDLSPLIALIGLSVLKGLLIGILM